MKKGNYGYLEKRKRRAILLAACMFLVTVGMFAAARIYFGTNKNVFSLLAAVMCLPTGKFIVDAVMYCRARGCSPEARAAVKVHKGRLPRAYDLYLTTYSENYQISHLVAAPGLIVGYTEDPACSLKGAEAHIRKMMEENDLPGYEVKIYRTRDKYLARLDQLNAKGELLPPETVQDIMGLLYSISL